MILWCNPSTYVRGCGAALRVAAVVGRLNESADRVRGTAYAVAANLRVQAGIDGQFRVLGVGAACLVAVEAGGNMRLTVNAANCFHGAQLWVFAAYSSALAVQAGKSIHKLGLQTIKVHILATFGLLVGVFRRNTGTALFAAVTAHRSDGKGNIHRHREREEMIISFVREW